jgi:hypothetical protein
VKRALTTHVPVAVTPAGTPIDRQALPRLISSTHVPFARVLDVMRER